MLPEHEKEKMAERLRKAINRCFSESEEIQEIIEELSHNHYQLNVWMMLGIILTPILEESLPDPEKTRELACRFTETDLDWLKSLHIDITGAE